MRVLHVNERARFLGGVERILHDTASSLAADGWSQALLHEAADVDHQFTAPFEMAMRSTDVVARFQPDVILVHKYGNTNRTHELARMRPAVRMVHDHDLVCLRRHKYLPISGRLCERAAGRACLTNLCFLQRSKPGAAFPITFRGLGEQRREMLANEQMRRYIVGSRWMRAQLEKNGFPAARIDVVHPIPRVLDSVGSMPASTSAQILYVGQVIRGKGVDLLLRALARLRQPWRATIVGDGNHLDACRRLARDLGIDDRVRFTGWIVHEELERFYSSARFAVVPSRWPEPFGMVGPEAMARGRPVVAFASGGIPDWLADGVTGLLVPPGDVPGLAGAMDRLLADSELATRMGRAAARNVADKLTHRGYVNSLKRCLEATQ